MVSYTTLKSTHSEIEIRERGNIVKLLSTEQSQTYEGKQWPLLEFSIVSFKLCNLKALFLLAI